MSNDDARGLETLERPHEPTRATDHPRPKPDGGLSYAGRLEAIDRLATTILTDVETDDDFETTDELVRHCREIRAEVECARRALPADQNHPSPDVPAVLDRGVGTTTLRGPDPTAVDRRADRDGGDDDGE